MIGAGPAGAAAARLLATWGHRVVVIDRPGSDASRLAESIPPSADKILRTIGALEAVRAARFIPWRGNTVWWANQPARIEAFPVDGVGYQVVRRDFDRLLHTLAGSAGARIEEGRVASLRLPQTFGEEGEVTVEKSDGVVEFRARVVIDASGRAGVIARNGLRVLDTARRTVALAGTWRARDRWGIEDETHTLVASYAGGWAWSVPAGPSHPGTLAPSHPSTLAPSHPSTLAPSHRQFTVMVDPGRSDLPKGTAARDVYLNELAKVAPFAQILSGAELLEAPWGADASEYTSNQYAGPGFLLAGDAGSAINPLSSLGVKKAMASGWLAAIAAHTSLTNAAMIADAFAFFDRRERAVATAAAHQAAEFAAAAASQTNHPFWLARVTAVEAGEMEPDVEKLARDPQVLAAFADLRSRPAVQLTPGRVRIEPRPAIRGKEITMEDHLVNEPWPEGLRYLRGVDLVALVQLAPRHNNVGELFDAVRSSSTDIDLPNFLGALSVLLANGSLKHE